MKEAYPIIEALKEKIRKNPNSDEAKGGKANINAFEKVERYFRYLGITEFPPVNDGFELDHDKDDKKPDTPSPPSSATIFYAMAKTTKSKQKLNSEGSLGGSPIVIFLFIKTITVVCVLLAELVIMFKLVILPW